MGSSLCSPNCQPLTDFCCVHEMEVKLIVILMVVMNAVPAAGWEGAVAPVPAGWEGAAAPGWDGVTAAPGNWDPVPQ